MLLTRILFHYVWFLEFILVLEVRLRPHPLPSVVCDGFDLDRQALVVAAVGALELVQVAEGGGKDCVELVGETVAGAEEVKEEGDAVGAGDEGEVSGGAADDDEGDVTGGDKLLDEGVVGEALF